MTHTQQKRARLFGFAFFNARQFLHIERSSVPEDLRAAYELRYRELKSAFLEKGDAWNVALLWVSHPEDRPAAEAWFDARAAESSFSGLCEMFLIAPIPVEPIVVSHFAKRIKAQDLAERSTWDWRTLEKIAKNPDKEDPPHRKEFYAWSRSLFTDAAALLDHDRQQEMRFRFMTPIMLKLGGTELHKFF